jgi:hypothetical protein
MTTDWLTDSNGNAGEGGEVSFVDRRPLTERLRTVGGLVPAVCDEAANEIERLSALSVALREEYLHLMGKVQATYDLLSGEFYAEALGELHDMLNPNPQSQYQAQEGK